MGKQQRRPWKGCYTAAAKRERTKLLSGNAAAEQYLRWRMQRDGIAWPRVEGWNRSIVVNFADGHAILSDVTERVWLGKREGYGRTIEEIMRIALPDHCMPFRRCDLWHEAHQAGLGQEDREAEGMGCRLDGRSRFATQEFAGLDVIERAALARDNKAKTEISNANYRAGWMIEEWWNENAAKCRLESRQREAA